MTARDWAEEGTLADMKNRLDKLRVDQSRQVLEDEPVKKDTLKILQSKFGSPVYDPTSPLQKAYDRRCARTGRRKSIEFEDLYLTKGSGLLHLPPPIPGSPKNRSGSASARKHPLLRTSTGADFSNQLQAAGSPRLTRVRKSSDPSSYYRKSDHGNGHGKTRHGGSDHGGHKGQGHRGLMHAPVSEEDKKVIDQKLAGLGGSDDGTHNPQQRRRKISSSSKTSSKH